MTDRIVIVVLGLIAALALLWAGYLWVDRRDLLAELAPPDEDDAYADELADAPHVDPHEPPGPVHGLPVPGPGPHLAPSLERVWEPLDWRETTFTGRLLAAATGTPEDMDAVFAGRRTA